MKPTRSTRLAALHLFVTLGGCVGSTNLYVDPSPKAGTGSSEFVVQFEGREHTVGDGVVVTPEGRFAAKDYLELPSHLRPPIERLETSNLNYCSFVGGLGGLALSGLVAGYFATQECTIGIGFSRGCGSFAAAGMAAIASGVGGSAIGAQLCAEQVDPASITAR